MNSVIRKILSIQWHPLCKRHFWNNAEKSLQIRTVLSIFSLIHMSCYWGVLGHIWVQICTNLHCLVVVYTLVVVGISLDSIQSVTAILSTRCSHLSYHSVGKRYLLFKNDCSEIHPYQTVICFRHLVYANHTRCIFAVFIYGLQVGL